MPVLEEELLLITYPAHPLAKKRADRAGRSDKQPFILFETGSITRRLVEEFFTRERIEPDIVMETENVEIIKAMVRNGLGISIIPVAGGGRRRAREAAVLQPHRGPRAAPADRVAVSEDEPAAAPGVRSDASVRADPAAVRGSWRARRGTY